MKPSDSSISYRSALVKVCRFDCWKVFANSRPISYLRLFFAESIIRARLFEAVARDMALGWEEMKKRETKFGRVN